MSAVLVLLLLAPSAAGIAASAAWNADLYVVPGLEVTVQSLPGSCGPALIATLASWRGRPVTEAVVLAQTTLGDDGISLAEFARLASLHGLEGAWYHLDVRRFAQLPLPFVVHLAQADGGHFVAVIAVGEESVAVVDPAAGARVGPATVLLRNYSGRAYLLDPSGGAAP